MTKEETRNQFDAMCEQSCWHSDCRRSPKPAIALTDGLVIEGEGWEPCPSDRGPQEGYEYGLEASSFKRGFLGTAASVYYRRMKRRVAT